MNKSKILSVLTFGPIFMVSFLSFAAAQDKATAKEVVAKVKDAASALSKSGDLAQFNQKSSQWVWNDTYIFIQDCDKMVLAAHPLRPDLIGDNMGSVKDPKGNSIFPDPKGLCEAARKSSGTWVEYQWAKPGEKEGSRKITYLLGAKGTPYVVCAGIYDDKATISDLSKMSAK
jgi:cytochrome c